MPQIVQTIIDYLIQVFSSIFCMMMCCDAVMKRRHRMTAYIVYVVTKTLIVNVFLLKYQLEYLGADGAIRSIYTGLLILAALLTYLFLLYTYDEDFVKIAIVSVGAELVTLIPGYIGKAIPAAFVGESLYEQIPTLHPTDFLTPFIAIAITYVALKLSNRAIQRLRNWEVKRKKTVMCIFVAYLSLSIYTMNGTLEEEAKIISVLNALLFAYLLIRYVNHFHQKMLWEKDSLKKQHSMVKMQYEAIVLQTEKIEHMQNEIQTQMQEILRISETAENKTEQIERYIASLKKQSENLTLGIFCDDRYLDQVCYYAKQLCDDKGIDCDFYLQGYQCKGEQTQKLAEEVGEMLENTIKKAKKEISMHMTTVKGQVVIRLGCDGREEHIIREFDKVQK